MGVTRATVIPMNIPILRDLSIGVAGCVVANGTNQEGSLFVASVDFVSARFFCGAADGCGAFAGTLVVARGIWVGPPAAAGRLGLGGEVEGSWLAAMGLDGWTGCDGASGGASFSTCLAGPTGAIGTCAEGTGCDGADGTDGT